MPRASRKDRKNQRRRATNATERGLPAPELELRNSPALRGSNSPASDAQGRMAGVDGSGQTRKPGWFSTWPLSVKILALTTLALLALSLWRTLTTPRGDEGEASSAPVPSVSDSPVASGQSSPQTGNQLE